MNFHVMTLFPEMILDGIRMSITGRAISRGIIDVNAVNIRDFATDHYRHVDDYPYGGGAGMVMQPGPIYDCYRHILSGIRERRGDSAPSPRLIYLSPQGKVFHQNMAKELAAEEDLIFLCGHYEGVDERILDMIVTDQVSIGDYVLTGGELPAMVMIDAIARMVPGVLTNTQSPEEESFCNGLLEYPQYTRPEVFMGERVPEVLLSGHHANIRQWRHEQSLLRTQARRPELLDQAELTDRDRQFLNAHSS